MQNSPAAGPFPGSGEPEVWAHQVYRVVVAFYNFYLSGFNKDYGCFIFFFL
jgi:hypothetical protein